MINFLRMIKNVFVNNYTKHHLNGDVIFHKRTIYISNKFGTETFSLNASEYLNCGLHEPSIIVHYTIKLLAPELFFLNFSTSCI